MARLTGPAVEALNDRQRAVFDAIALGPRGGVRGPFALLLHSPELADKVQALGRFCRYESSLPPRLLELAVLTIAVHWRSGYEWDAHEPLARKAGISGPVIAALGTGAEPSFEHHDEEAVYKVLTELSRTRRVSRALYRTAVEALGETALIELIAIAGYYTLLAMVINVFEIDAATSLPATKNE